MLQHRPFVNNDLQTICSFPQNMEELFYFFPKATYPLTPAQLKMAIDQRSDSTVVEQNGDVAGFANFYRWQDKTCCVGNVIVSPLTRGRGVAKYLIKTMIHLASTRHAAKSIEISCFNHNTAGILLYRKLGFKPFDIEERQGPNGRRVALIHMCHKMDKT
ncbi:GNAT family N-acetyltransferase [Desulfobacter curvatus]|uniref:GNAT family N-acetyltransferase n=1 Tax=Desulfobacter curvatus TaxID=2290 RepID=UPI0003637FD9|nr:GNAT family N-acetyltransferase [Desulfobacter curvatus]